MRKKLIPDDIIEKVKSIIEQFNQKELRNLNCYYVARFQSKFLYLDRYYDDNRSPICRLKYNGKYDEWEFAIFKWSSETYDPEEYFFPGRQLVDGTIEGAMKAGMQAYPF